MKICDQGFAGERGNPLDRLVQLQVRSVHLGVLLESVTKPLLLLLLQQNISAEKRNWNMMSLLLLVQKKQGCVDGEVGDFFCRGKPLRAELTS